MTPAYAYTIVLILLLAILALAAYVDRIYSEMGKFLAREYQDNIDSWERRRRTPPPPRPRVHRSLRLGPPPAHPGRARPPLPAFASTPTPASSQPSPAPQPRRDHPRRLRAHPPHPHLRPSPPPAPLLPHPRPLDQPHPPSSCRRSSTSSCPVTLLLGLLLSIAALAEPEDTEEEDHPSEAMDALLEAGEEEGILEESDRELVRSAVEFGDKVVLEVMTPRPEIFAVPGTLTLQRVHRRHQRARLLPRPRLLRLARPRHRHRLRP